MTQVEHEILKLEQEVKSLEARTKLSEKIYRLYANQDFKDVILDGWMVQEAAAYAKEAGNPAMPKDAREDAISQALAAGHLERFLEAKMQMGNDRVREAISELEDRISYMRAHGTIEGYGEEE